MPDPTLFTLDARLAGDTLVIGDLDLCRVLLMDDMRFTWLILVPRIDGLDEIDQLEPAQRARLMDEAVRCSEALRACVAVDKINIGALGNIVRQLHVHVVARRMGDPAWPGPVWGSGKAVPYPPQRARELLGALGEHLRASPGQALAAGSTGQPPVGK